MDNRAIGIFDSGVGGLTVLAEIRKALPNENIIYLGDTKNFPYGNRSKEDGMPEEILTLHPKDVDVELYTDPYSSKYGEIKKWIYLKRLKSLKFFSCSNHYILIN